MPPSAFFKSFLKSSPAKTIRVAVARGLAPVPPDEMLALLVHLTNDPDPEVANVAENSLASSAEEDLLRQAQSPSCAPEVLGYLAAKGSSIAVLEAVILNPATPGDAIEVMSSRVPAPLLDAILYNRVRLLEHPGILAGVKANPAITPELQRIILEVETEFFGEKKKDYSIGTAEAAGEEPLPESDLELEPAPDDLSLEGLPLDADEREAVLRDRIARMTVPQRIRHAILGNREARSILIRDPNRQVAQTVLQSPKLTESEVATFAAMRNISEDVLRDIGNSRALTRSYAVVQNLVHNPKTPALISQRMLTRLHNKDLAGVARDRGVPEIVRRNAQRTLNQRTSQRSP